MRRWGVGALGLLAVLTVAGCGSSGASSEEISTPASIDRNTVPMNTGRAPWPAPDRAVDRMAVAGLPALDREALDFHHHAHLDVYVDGTRVPVAAGLGIDVDAKKISPLHTHDDSGILHMEAPRKMTFTLGQVFDEWGVRLTDACVGGYCRPETPIAVVVDGKQRTGDPRDVELANRQEIALLIGTRPDKVPTAFDPG